MERLTGLDASFLYLETPSLHMHVSMAAVFDPRTVPGGYSYDKVRELVHSRLELAPIFRRRLVEVPFRLGHPYWVDDAGFDIDYHLRRAALPQPGGLAELAQFVGDINSRQLDRSKPLWEMHIVEGLEGGNIAMVTKIHHATIDGVSGAELLTRLFDLQPDPSLHDAQLAPAEMDTRHPSDVELVAQALLARLVRPIEITKLAWKTGKAVLDLRRVRSSASTGSRAALPLTTPRTSLNQAVTPYRSVAFASIALDDVKRLKNKLGCTVNDIVLAICTGALRRYLIAGDELPEQPLVVTVPVSVRPSEGAQLKGSNKVSAMWVGLPCAVDDPLRRVELIKEGTKGAKEEHNAIGADVLMQWTEHATPNVFAAAARAYTRLKLAERHRPIHSLVISNIPGPDFPLYLAGAELIAGFPLGPVMDGAGLNVTVMSYRGALNWGFMACRETVPRVWDLARFIGEALEELLESAGLPKATRAGIAPVTNGPAPQAKKRPRSATSSRSAKSPSSRKTAAKPPSRPLSQPAADTNRSDRDVVPQAEGAGVADGADRTGRAQGAKRV